jgi:hypothetical protein
MILASQKAQKVNTLGIKGAQNVNYLHIASIITERSTNSWFAAKIMHTYCAPFCTCVSVVAVALMPSTTLL